MTFWLKKENIRKKGTCGMLFRLKIQFYPPKRPLRDDLLSFSNEIYDIGTKILLLQ